MAGVLGELVLDWGAESVLESGRGLCLSRVFNPQTGFFTGLIKDIHEYTANYYQNIKNMQRHCKAVHSLARFHSPELWNINWQDWQYILKVSSVTTITLDVKVQGVETADNISKEIFNPLVSHNE